MKRRTDSLISNIEFGNSSGAEEFLDKLRMTLPISHATYLGVHIPAINASRDYFLTTYSADWADRYYEKSYQNIDPVISQGMSGILPFDWQRRRRDQREIEHFFGEAREFGISKQGLSIPIRGAQGERALFSINAEMSDADWQHFKQDMIGELTLLAYYFHLSVMQMEVPHEFRPPPALSQRESDVLRWAAEGKSVDDTATILGIGSNSVKVYIRNAMVKLGTVNKTQTVAKAILFNLI